MVEQSYKYQVVTDTKTGNVSYIFNIKLLIESLQFLEEIIHFEHNYTQVIILKWE